MTTNQKSTEAPVITKGPEDRSSFTANLRFTASARDAWREILRRITIAKGQTPRLLLPAYIGETSREGRGYGRKLF